MLASYKNLFAKPGTKRFSITSFFPRMASTMMAISIIVFISLQLNSYALAGTVSATAVIMQAIFSPQIARLVDRYGQRRIMYPTTSVCTVAMVLLIIAVENRWPSTTYYLFSALTGATIGSYNALVRARWVNQISTPRDLHTAFSWEATLDEISFMVGPALATIMATELTTYSALALASVVLAVGAFAFLSDKSTEPKPVVHSANTSKHGVLHSRAMLVIVLMFIAIGALFGAGDVSVIRLSQEAHFEAFGGVILAVWAGGSAISGFIYGTLHRECPVRKRFVRGAVGIGATAIVFMLVSNIYLMALMMFINGLFIAPTYINGNALIKEHVAPHRLTEGLAWMSTGLNLGASLGSSLAGFAIDARGAFGGFSVSSSFGFFATLLALCSIPVFKRQVRVLAGPKIPLQAA